MASHGNYKGYQGISRYDGQNSASHVVDLRLEALNDAVPELFLGKDVLDVGCNNGAISVHLALTFNPSSVTGVDVDRELITKAKSHLSFRYSRTAPSPPSPPPASIGEKIDIDIDIDTTTPADTNQGSGSRDHINYFPISSIISHGHRPYPLAAEGHIGENGTTAVPVAAEFPHNVHFRYEDWAVGSGRAEKECYDVVLALSVVKWVHLDHLDDGLRRFFTKCHTSLRKSGYFILELQGQDSYQKAVKKNKPLKENLQKLQIKPEDFGTLLKEELGFECVHVIEGVFKRGIYVYQKK